MQTERATPSHDGLSVDPPAIGDYGLIGDCQSAALISRDGALDWLCWPRFDSPAVFAGLLDPTRGGRWEIHPCVAFESTHRYLANTNVLETQFDCATGVATLTDFMPLADEDYRRRHLMPDHSIVRLLRCGAGNVDFQIRFAPWPNFGMDDVKIVDRGKLGLRVSSSHGMLALHSPIHFRIADGVASATRAMKAGDEIPLILTYAEASPETLPLLSEAGASLSRTIEWWQNWSATNTYKGPHRDAVMRSVLALKLLQFCSSGAFIAAPTTSLPERVGGKLNWDYRYCWLRDASFTIEALTGTGFVAEAEAFAEWLLHATRLTQPKLMVMYDVWGNHGPREKSLSHLKGYRDSAPVHIGNAARSQSQLDTYGEVVSGAATLIKHKRQPADRETSKVLVGFGRYVCKHWSEPDAGIWEGRGDPVVHTHSRLLCWAALNALLELNELKLIRAVPAELFSKTRDEIRRSIETESWDQNESTYTNEPGSLELDATLLLIPVHRFADASSERMRQTCARIERKLEAGGSLLYRNLPADGKPIEGAFAICGFWRVHFLALGGGSLQEAEQAFVELLGTSNDLGLFGEETDPHSGAVLGNFPQAFTHLGLINAALAIERRRHAEGGAA